MPTHQDILTYVAELKRLKTTFVLSGLICIPASVVLSYTQRSPFFARPWFDILFFGVLLIPAVATYLLASKLFTRTKSFLLAAGMFIPTIVIQLIILIGLWLGINRALSAYKSTR
jgi:hypothetical protein